MGTLEAFLVILAVISGGLVIWSYTKSGKKWLNYALFPRSGNNTLDMR